MDTSYKLQDCKGYMDYMDCKDYRIAKATYYKLEDYKLQGHPSQPGAPYRGPAHIHEI